jgi:hypothetical protein
VPAFGGGGCKGLGRRVDWRVVGSVHVLVSSESSLEGHVYLLTKNPLPEVIWEQMQIRAQARTLFSCCVRGMLLDLDRGESPASSARLISSPPPSSTGDATSSRARPDVIIDSHSGQMTRRCPGIG